MTIYTDPVRGQSDPERFWVLTNLSEATPGILSPLCWSVWGRPLEEGFLNGFHRLGVLSKKEAVFNADPNVLKTSAIYGRQAYNVEAARWVVARLPGVGPDDQYRDLLGFVPENAPEVPKTSIGRTLAILGKLPGALLSADRILKRDFAAVQEWWRTEVRDVYKGVRAPAEDSFTRLLTAQSWFGKLFEAQVVTRMQFQMVQSQITNAAIKAGDQGLALKAFSGWGNVLEVEMSDKLWQVAHGTLSEEEFLDQYGFHGPYEGNVFTKSWREEPARVRALVNNMRERNDMTRPIEREVGGASEAKAAQAEILRKIPAAQRGIFTFMLARAQNIVRNTEIGKAGFLMGLDGARAAAREIGAEQVAAGRLREVDDAFFLTIEELRSLIAGELPDAEDIVEYRRAQRARYEVAVMPPFFKGIPDLDTLSVTSAEPDDGAIEFSGVAAGGGQVTGRARVVLDPNDDVDLEPGDILVCKFTDPSWAPLFTMAEALVIDLGAAGSHGAVVAREMGIPYIIGTTDGTARLRDGDRVLVDGEANVVRVLERASPQA